MGHRTYSVLTREPFGLPRIVQRFDGSHQLPDGVLGNGNDFGPQVFLQSGVDAQNDHIALP